MLSCLDYNEDTDAENRTYKSTLLNSDPQMTNKWAMKELTK